MKLKDFDFRLWDKQSKSFVEIKSAFPTTNEKDEIIIVPLVPDENIEIELWSGIRDKNGKKIYENDVVRAISGALFIVSIDEDIKNWIVTNILCQGIDSQALMQLIEHTEVIGNIHENAYLLDNHNKEQE
ncbi:hypothetical protein T36_1295 [Helicobacter cinaedi]|uniref:YopX family protein n=1 Tax=Helicobacter cinaedi TaxID=213 RepID=UPI001F2537FB|nr:YopX family protein [Helicobacter cinaedi]BDB64838.1 hypothetical protein T36_1295 [Helicobacter cinaedi]